MNTKHLVYVVGAGPAGLYAAQQLASQPNTEVVLLNRDIKPGGLAEYGIYHSKHKMKEGLRGQFRKIMALPNLRYFGNVVVGQESGLTLADLQASGADAILVCVGAQGTKWLELPGEHLHRAFHAKEIVYHYNQLPPFSEETYAIGKHVVVVGVGNVAMDIAHHLVHDVQAETVTIVARRSAADVKFTQKELEGISANLDTADFTAEIARIAPIMQAAGQDVASAQNYILNTVNTADPSHSATQVRMRFLLSPTQIVDDGNGNVGNLKLEDTTLKLREDGTTSARGLGTFQNIPCDTVIFAIGDAADPHIGLPIGRNGYQTRPTARFPQEENNYEAWDADNPQAVENVFLAGWARNASVGLVGIARKDGTNGAKAVLAYLADKPTRDITADLAALSARLLAMGAITRDDWKVLEAEEARLMKERGLPVFKFSSNAEMLQVIKGDH
ncbi:MAG TPA: FAD-dependent oxidoreductase [Anaerolineales bacterium]|nr:FAD-dependent oxidoreductase [Anaerolineales bacterium]